MGEIISLHDDPHDRIDTLLPWYVTGTLEAPDVVTVEAHLADCATCRAALEGERALARQVAELPLDVERGLAALRARIDPVAATVPTTPVVPVRARWTPAARWLVGAQAAAILLLGGGLVISVPRATPDYHVLGTAPVTAAGNIVVTFRPAMPERSLRALLGAADARLVDGPTVAGAYVLRVPAAERGAALERLRAQADVVMAEPIDAGGPP